jgi:hypothetical protein
VSDVRKSIGHGAWGIEYGLRRDGRSGETSETRKDDRRQAIQVSSSKFRVPSSKLRAKNGGFPQLTVYRPPFTVYD